MASKGYGVTRFKLNDQRDTWNVIVYENDYAGEKRTIVSIPLSNQDDSKRVLHQMLNLLEKIVP